jgi:hypothetical protein
LFQVTASPTSPSSVPTAPSSSACFIGRPGASRAASQPPPMPMTTSIGEREQCEPVVERLRHRRIDADPVCSQQSNQRRADDDHEHARDHRPRAQRLLIPAIAPYFTRTGSPAAAAASPDGRRALFMTVAMAASSCGVSGASITMRGVISTSRSGAHALGLRPPNFPFGRVVCPWRGGAVTVPYRPMSGGVVVRMSDQAAPTCGGPTCIAELARF